MTKQWYAGSVTYADTFEVNYVDPTEGTRAWLRRLDQPQVFFSETESTITFPNGATRIVMYHGPGPNKINWSDDRVGAADWTARLRTGATGDANVELREVHIRRVSSDGNTIRASISNTSYTDGLTADTNFDKVFSANTSLDNPAGAAASDHLVIVFVLTNTSAMGPDETVAIEQNLTPSTHLLVPVDDPVPSTNVTQAIIIA